VGCKWIFMMNSGLFCHYQENHQAYISRKSYTTKNVLWSRASVCLCVCLSSAVCPNYCMDPDVTWGSGRGCPLVVHYWADFQSVHWLCCYGNTMEMHSISSLLRGVVMRTRNVSKYMLVLALCLVISCV